ncbi:MAG TPA: Crp/Fnr family transcriptional regulator [Pedobacter sp.]|uniref:Crp/Fnr family transcriptional regulator n=1 Tax=Pedobacter sp. TaxID=1411316 RepID=UPI002CA9E0C5|nr:Crp/Fnr family transcriptional regulator [Pedobacter sp.]HMI02593.1 Crp/Fnr family transcriptional regulator [Pedobacter sp.]
MLNNDKAFNRLMALLRSIDPKNPLPEELEPYLLLWMIDEPYCKKERSLEYQGEVPKNAYYVVHGLVKVYAWCPNGYRYLYRIYRENTIVALKCFMDQEVSAFEIVACKNTLVRSISHAHMQKIYKHMEGMREMALKTAFMYSEAQEKLRTDLLALDVEARLLKFYSLFKGLLPARTGPIRDEDVAGYLILTKIQLKKVRMRLKKLGLIVSH